ncbi:MAG: energy-coupling factor ABC transporter permease [Candidatus Sumerlaeota bacterium]|nr:energy-coupling factor ABC transporter permease [Candidatus Sumerlaeota bacterium]
MHMADALISPAVGGAMWAATGALTAYSAKKLKAELDERKVPLMGVLGAFIFSAQMINFSIPGTGSSGHIGGGMILAILLGPYAAFLTIASVVAVQALFFADGGLLALGCNIFNMGFFPCFIAYPLIYKKIVGDRPTQGRILLGSTLSAVLGLQMGAFSVVLETVFSRVSELPFATFVLLMQPIHLAIGFVEGLITSAVVGFVWKARPEILELAADAKPIGNLSVKKVLVGLGMATALTAGLLSWFASTHPDGLEWSMFKTSGKEELKAPERGVHAAAESLQQTTAILPDYDFKKPAKPSEPETPAEPENKTDGAAPVVSAGASVAGLVGAAITLVLVGLLGVALRMRRASN